MLRRILRVNIDRQFFSLRPCQLVGTRHRPIPDVSAHDHRVLVNVLRVSDSSVSVICIGRLPHYHPMVVRLTATIDILRVCFFLHVGRLY